MLLTIFFGCKVVVVMAHPKLSQLVAVLAIAVLAHLEIATGQTNVCTAPPQTPDTPRKLQQLKFAAVRLLYALLYISATRALSGFIPRRLSSRASVVMF